MATMSIEVLCVGATKLHLPNAIHFGMEYDFPPVSDRSPSIWQPRIDTVGGALVHLFDRERVGKNQRWAYNIIEEKDWTHFRFNPEVWNEVKNLLKYIIDASPNKSIEFYSDAQWSNIAKINLPAITFNAFIRLHDERQLRMNTAYPISEGA